MPSNVAMHKPRARIICFEGKEKPALGGKHGNIPPDRIGALQAWNVGGRVKNVAHLSYRISVRRTSEYQEVVPLLETLDETATN